MNLPKIVPVLICFILSFSGYTQTLKPKFGLKAGMNLSTMFADIEENTTEGHRFSIRIAVGGSVKLPLHERYGLIGEVTFVQKGSNSFVESDNSFIKLPTFGVQQETVLGYTVSGGTYTKRLDNDYKKRVALNTTNGYIEVPLSFYAELIDDKLELDFGVSLGFLISSNSLGTLKFGPKDVLEADNPVTSEFIEMDLDYKYLGDDLNALYDPTSKSAKIDGTTIYYPRGPSAYYFTDQTDKQNQQFYHIFDLGIHAGLSFYLTQGLKLGTRVTHSLLDITNQRYDHSFTDLNSDGSYILKDDKDYNFGIQIFIGLQF